MKINNNTDYALHLWEEESGRGKHNITSRKDFIISGSDLYDSIISMGMLPSEIKNIQRNNEIRFKLDLIEAFLDTEQDNGKDYLKINKTAMEFLDPSEKNSISYWLGMFFATALAKKQYNYDYVIHYSKYVKSKYYQSITTKRVKGSKLKSNTKSTPDLIAANSKFDKYGIFEAKGNRAYKAKTMEHAYDQAKRIGKINNIAVSDNIISLTVVGSKQNILRYKDPKGEENLSFDIYPALLWQCIPSFELFSETEHKRDNGFLYAWVGDEFRMRMPIELYSFYEENHELILSGDVNETTIRTFKGLSQRITEKQNVIGIEIV